MNGFKSLLAAMLLAAAGAPPALAQENGGFEFELTIDPVGSVDPQSGLVRITGEVTCSEPALSAVNIELIQPLGRRSAAQAFGNTGLIECDITPTPFEVTFVSVPLRFGPGAAVVRAFGGACFPGTEPNPCDQGDDDNVTTTVRLRSERL